MCNGTSNYTHEGGLPSWEDGDLTGWLSHTECYFHYHRTLEASMVDIATIHLEGDAIQWYDCFKHTHGVPKWSEFKSELLIRLDRRSTRTRMTNS
ncbi:hypothetical protein BHE74_00029632 [Ensete ventricosum]|nr:hypothetical protein BHE74_00029632 [Ensete ventricosum]RZR90666.1 hypothetical protein BHM03_00018588 [Ensete ventricosum]